MKASYVPCSVFQLFVRTMQLKIKQVTGDSTFSVVGEEGSTVLELKQAVADKLGDGITPESIRLIYRGQILKDPQPLSSYGEWCCIEGDRRFQ